MSLACAPAVAAMIPKNLFMKTTKPLFLSPKLCNTRRLCLWGEPSLRVGHQSYACVPALVKLFGPLGRRGFRIRVERHQFARSKRVFVRWHTSYFGTFTFIKWGVDKNDVNNLLYTALESDLRTAGVFDGLKLDGAVKTFYVGLQRA